MLTTHQKYQIANIVNRYITPEDITKMQSIAQMNIASMMNLFAPELQIASHNLTPTMLMQMQPSQKTDMVKKMMISWIDAPGLRALPEIQSKFGSIYIDREDCVAMLDFMPAPYKQAHINIQNDYFIDTFSKILEQVFIDEFQYQSALVYHQYENNSYDF